MNSINLLSSLAFILCLSIVIFVPIWQVKQNKKK